MEEEKPDTYLKGRGAQLNTQNRFSKLALSQEHIEGIDEQDISNTKTQVYLEYPKKIVNKVESPDTYGTYSMNPYQGCEHGCIYCYARNTHEYWGFSAGLDFERKIIAKPQAAELLRKQLLSKKWIADPIMLSGNTDCYQPLERKMKLTRKMLEVLLEFKHPVGLITKNSLILRDTDILQELAKLKLVHVMVSITTMREELRLTMEPRTATIAQRLKVIEDLTKAGVPTGVMAAPIIPGLNSHEIPAILEEAANNGAINAGYTMVRLNGSIAEIFKDWIHKSFPDAADKVLNQIAEVHGGQLNDSRFGVRMKGEGNIADGINSLFKASVKKYMQGRRSYELDTTIFTRPTDVKGQFSLF